jgi:hypothetical protein
MMRWPSSAATFVLLAPVFSSCSAQSARDPRPATVVHHMTNTTTLVEHGDTLLVIRGPSEAVPRDSIGADGKPIVMVALLLPDSTYVLTNGRRTPMNPSVAKHLRAILQLARDEDAGRRPKPSPR